MPEFFGADFPASWRRSIALMRDRAGSGNDCVGAYRYIQAHNSSCFLGVMKKPSQPQQQGYRQRCFWRTLNDPKSHRHCGTSARQAYRDLYSARVLPRAWSAKSSVLVSRNYEVIVSTVIMGRYLSLPDISRNGRSSPICGDDPRASTSTGSTPSCLSIDL